MSVLSRAAGGRIGSGGGGGRGGGAGRRRRRVVVKAEESGCSVGVDRIQIEDGSQRQRVVTAPHAGREKRTGRRGGGARPRTGGPVFLSGWRWERGFAQGRPARITRHVSYGNGAAVSHSDPSRKSPASQASLF